VPDVLILKGNAKIERDANTEITWRKSAVRIVVLMRGEPNLFQIVLALSAPRRFAGRLHRRQQQRDQYSDDRYDHQQLD
jgi:hypothetical protein